MKGKIITSKIILGLHCIALALILSSVYATGKPHITIQLREAKKLHIVVLHRTVGKELDEQPPTIQGALNVAIINQSAHAVELVDWNVHNLFFRDRDGVCSMLIHDCELINIAVTYTETGKIAGAFTLGPGETKVITLDSFCCDGPFYSLPDKGIYRGGDFAAVYRIMPLDAVRAQLSRHLIGNTDITALLKQMERLVTSDDFWTGAYVSDPCCITLNSP
ncbi:MAG: hypothetical protein JXA50_01265 [Deltaproteobacteria bacterium]|nr:hypothetical protein [Deltaproteobacteria bacterium]